MSDSEATFPLNSGAAGAPLFPQAPGGQAETAGRSPQNLPLVKLGLVSAVSMAATYGIGIWMPMQTAESQPDGEPPSPSVGTVADQPDPAAEARAMAQPSPPAPTQPAAVPVEFSNSASVQQLAQDIVAEYRAALSSSLEVTPTTVRPSAVPIERSSLAQGLEADGSDHSSPESAEELPLLGLAVATPSSPDQDLQAVPSGIATVKASNFVSAQGRALALPEAPESFPMEMSQPPFGLDAELEEGDRPDQPELPQRLDQSVLPNSGSPTFNISQGQRTQYGKAMDSGDSNFSLGRLQRQDQD